MRKYTRQQITDLKGIPDFTLSHIDNDEYAYFIDSDGDDDFELTVESIGISYPDPNYCISRNRRNKFVFEYVTDGVGYVENEGKKYTVTRGDVYVLEPYSAHKYYSDRQRPYSKLWINFRSKLFEKLFADLKLAGVTVFKNVDCADLFMRLRELENTSVFNERIRYEAMEILLAICARLKKSMSEKTATQNETVAHIRRILDCSLHTDISLDEICARLNVSQSYVLHAFKAAYGVTPHRYLLDNKLRLACGMLKNTRKPITEIAADLGFNDSFYFSKLFKKKLAVSPSDYRANNSDNDPPSD